MASPLPSELVDASFAYEAHGRFDRASPDAGGSEQTYESEGMRKRMEASLTKLLRSLEQAQCARRREAELQLLR